MKLSFSFIIPVYNRPDEIRELLESLAAQTFSESFEIVIIEDGSTESSERVIDEFKGRKLRVTGRDANRYTIQYLKKPNTGPGDSRNYGMARAKGDYFIILDSDCILPPRYLETVSESLREDFVHCYGGPDAAHASFSLVQKAINYSMTAVLTTGGIRGSTFRKGRPAASDLPPSDSKGQAHPSKGRPSPSAHRRATSNFQKAGFQPRSFNMGLSRPAFEATGGFGNIHPGEDPDLVFRIWGRGYETRLIPEAFVYHKRRIDWKKFHTQVTKFGMVRPILNRRFPKTAKMTYWFPTFFCLGLVLAVIFWAWGIALPLYLYSVYFILIFIDSLLKNRSLAIALLSLLAVGIQFIGYGFGFLKSAILITFSGKKPEKLFPKLFFTHTDTAV